MGTNVYINQPPPVPTLIAIQSNQWSTGICDCCDDLSICCFAYWCYPCFACHTASQFGECCCLPLLDAGMGYTPPVSMSMRVAVRYRYGIQGDIGGDCIYATCCNLCSWCQMAREIKRRKTTINPIIAQPVQMGVQQYMVTAT